MEAAHYMTALKNKLQRVNVIGTSGSGKSTFSKKLAEKLDMQWIELDSLFWEPNWKEPSDEIFFNRITEALEGDRWVLDGNYTRTVPIKWRNVTTVITREELWSGTGNKESFFNSFLSKKSILLWTLKTYKKNKMKYESVMVDPDFSHINFIKITNHREAKLFLDSL
jgi:hypothetical protein